MGLCNNGSTAVKWPSSTFSNSHQYLCHKLEALTMGYNAFKPGCSSKKGAIRYTEHRSLSQQISIIKVMRPVNELLERVRGLFISLAS